MTEPLHTRAYNAANAIWPAQFGEPQENIDQRWAYHAGFVAGWEAAKREESQPGESHAND